MRKIDAKVCFLLKFEGKELKKTRQSSSVLGELARSVGGIITYF